MRIADGRYVEAYKTLVEANDLIPENPVIVNNMAFCLFYSGNLSAAISLIEGHLNTQTANCLGLSESMIFNLCNLYELESARALQKKLALLHRLNTTVGDGFYEVCLQLQ